MLNTAFVFSSFLSWFNAYGLVNDVSQTKYVNGNEKQYIWKNFTHSAQLIGNIPFSSCFSTSSMTFESLFEHCSSRFSMEFFWCLPVHDQLKFSGSVLQTLSNHSYPCFKRSTKSDYFWLSVITHHSLWTVKRSFTAPSAILADKFDETAFSDFNSIQAIQTNK